MALFTGDTLPVDGDFGSEDRLTTTPTAADTTNKFAITADAANLKGADVGATGARKLYLDFRAPTSNTVATEQSITVTVTASAG